MEGDLAWRGLNRDTVPKIHADNRNQGDKVQILLCVLDFRQSVIGGALEHCHQSEQAAGEYCVDNKADKTGVSEKLHTHGIDNDVNRNQQQAE